MLSRLPESPASVYTSLFHVLLSRRIGWVLHHAGPWPGDKARSAHDSLKRKVRSSTSQRKMCKHYRWSCDFSDNDDPGRQDQFMTTKCHLPKGWRLARRRRCAHSQACGRPSLSMTHQIFADDSHGGISRSEYVCARCVKVARR